MFRELRLLCEFAGHVQSSTSSLPASEYVLFGQTRVKFANPPGQYVFSLQTCQTKIKIKKKSIKNYFAENISTCPYLNNWILC